MPDLNQLQTALKNADAAGDAAGATMLANEIKRQQSAPQAPAQPQDSTAMNIAKDAGSAIVRPVAKAVGALPLAAMDAGVATRNMVGDAYNKATGKPATPDYEMPSKMFEDDLDSFTRKPTGKAAQLAEDVSAGLLMPQSAEEKAAAAILGKAPSVREKLLDEGHTAGFTYPPSETGRKVGQAVQTLSGKAAVEREASLKNQAATDRLAKVELGMHPDDVLDSAALERLRKPAYAAYEAVANTGTVKADEQYINDVIGAGKKFTQSGTDFPGSVHPDIDKLKATYLQQQFTARGAIDAMKQLRADASKNLKNYDPEKNAVGLVQREISDALLSKLDRQAAESGNPQLVKQFTEARKQLAKIQTVEDSMVGSHVSAKELGKLYSADKPLTGNLALIGRNAEEFPKAFQEVGKQGEWGPYSVVDLFLGAGGIGSAVTSGATGHGGAAVAAGTAAAARPLARAALRSKPYQKLSTAARQPSVVKPALKAKIPSGMAVAETSPDLGESQP